MLSENLQIIDDEKDYNCLKIIKKNNKFSISSNSIKSKKCKQKLIGNCLDFLMNLLRYVDFILDKIGEGGFGTVYMCFNEKENSKYLYAVKCIKSSKSINSGERERRFGYVSNLNSEYLVKYHETFTFNNDLYVVMPYFENGNLYDFIKRYREKKGKIEEFVYFYFI
jgi:hypothetical protein